MTESDQPARLRFDSFELDLRTGELQKQGSRIRLQDQPTKLLILLASRSGELVTREEIQTVLWPDRQFVEFDHAINTAIKKIRDALGDGLGKRRIVETLPRKGYRFLVPVEALAARDPSLVGDEKDSLHTSVEAAQITGSDPEDSSLDTNPADGEAEMEFALPRGPAWSMFLMIQVGYLAMYCTALYYTGAVESVLRAFEVIPVHVTLPLVVVTAMCGIAVRLYLLSSVGFAHPAAGRKFQKLFPVLLVLDGLWAASPLLASTQIGIGVSLAGAAGLAYVPFSQRTLIQSVYRHPPGPVSGSSQTS